MREMTDDVVSVRVDTLLPALPPACCCCLLLFLIIIKFYIIYLHTDQNTKSLNVADLFDEDGESLVLVRLGEVDGLGTVRTDGQRRYYHV